MNTNIPQPVREVTIKRIDINQVDLLTKYRLEYLQEMQGNLLPEYKAHLEQDLNRYFKEAIENNRLFAYVAMDEEQVLSFGAMVIKKIPGDANKSIYLEGDILNMYTLPQERRKGYSAIILNELINEAKRLGISKISLHTSKDGEKLYRKFQFSEPQYPVLELVL